MLSCCCVHVTRCFVYIQSILEAWIEIGSFYPNCVKKKNLKKKRKLRKTRVENIHEGRECFGIKHTAKKTEAATGGVL